MAKVVYDQQEGLARMAVDETRMGSTKTRWRRIKRGVKRRLLRPEGKKSMGVFQRRPHNGTVINP